MREKSEVLKVEWSAQGRIELLRKFVRVAARQREAQVREQSRSLPHRQGSEGHETAHGQNSGEPLVVMI